MPYFLFDLLHSYSPHTQLTNWLFFRNLRIICKRYFHLIMIFEKKKKKLRNKYINLFQSLDVMLFVHYGFYGLDFLHFWLPSLRLCRTLTRKNISLMLRVFMKKTSPSALEIYEMNKLRYYEQSYKTINAINLIDLFKIPQ